MAEGGIMGWFADGQMQDEIGEQVFTMKKGEYTDVVETPLGLHIVRVNDTAQEGDKRLVHVSQIVVKKKSFATFLEERGRDVAVRLYLSEYAWDAQKAVVVFTDPDMLAFEDKVHDEAVQMTRNLLQGMSATDADATSPTQEGAQK